MGAWDMSITGNDTARDLLAEYAVAFFCYEPPEAVRKIDMYVRSNLFDESDQEEWCDYIYSLADFMWKKGILTDELRQTAIHMIDAGFGLELWAESGEKALEKRKKVLAVFKKQLQSPMPPKKKITLNVHLKPIFETGDIVAIELQTAEKDYTENDVKPISDSDFKAYDGKYILIQKIKDDASWRSSLEPGIRDYWAVFRLFDGIYDEIPAELHIHALKNSGIQCAQGLTPLFLCESSMSYFRKRKYQVVCNDKTDLEKYSDMHTESIFFGINKPWSNPDSSLLSAMGKELEFFGIAAIDTDVHNLIEKINRWNRFRYNLSREENERIFVDEKSAIVKLLERVLLSGGTIYGIRFGRVIGLCAILNQEIKYIGIAGQYRNNGFGTALLRFVASRTGNATQIALENESAQLLHICQKLKIPVSASR